MIEVKKVSSGAIQVKSSVSDFCAAMGYCELRIKHFLRGIRPPQTQIMIEGIASHEKEEAYEKEHFKFEPVTSEELKDLKKDIEFIREGLYTRYTKELTFGGESVSLLIYGRADKVMRSQGTLIVEDSKYPQTKDKYLDKYEPYNDQKLQTLLYLNSLFSDVTCFDQTRCFEISCNRKAWIINIKDKFTLQSIKIFQGYQTKQAEDFLNQKISRFVLLVLDRMQPTHHENVNKCRSCRFKDCEYCKT
ncbi:MAG: PD-(D/E)XK nuclease family protein [Candidatus Bathyarchaeota archaeon]|nr:PD-(D/E)XK nuclease family protein [Candidatus Bathyarchaeota archaeon]MDD4325316.1 PD-(D/E)XK nuclease family protein [Candidatus Bathyarchaeota archaeon]MDI9578695.1 PD-(D/E)XK nuclease family protein [Thermoproteota archaeon]MDT8782567.1 PD-(D/E)XK nuclease family protein [Candidatus Bathyarchaeota archaeon]NLD65519.1 type VI secretion system contractile sheath large subunit [Thermoproteota archaeon]